MDTIDIERLRATFDAPAPLTVGIEEEVMLLDSQDAAGVGRLAAAGAHPLAGPRVCSTITSATATPARSSARWPRPSSCSACTFT